MEMSFTNIITKGKAAEKNEEEGTEKKGDKCPKIGLSAA